MAGFARQECRGPTAWLNLASRSAPRRSRCVQHGWFNRFWCAQARMAAFDSTPDGIVSPCNNSMHGTERNLAEPPRVGAT